jgi:hypothetical protein
VGGGVETTWRQSEKFSPVFMSFMEKISKQLFFYIEINIEKFFFFHYREWPILGHCGFSWKMPFSGVKTQCPKIGPKIKKYRNF